MSIYVAGSMAFDRIMTFNGAFADHILADKLHILNVSFLIDGLVEKRGGCAGNIAYTLALMGEKPLILATVGKNFTDYGDYLRSLGLSLEGIRVVVLSNVDDKLAAEIGMQMYTIAKSSLFA